VILKDSSTFYHFCRWWLAKALDHYRLSWSSCFWEFCWLWNKLKVYLDAQGVLFEDDTAEDLVSKHHCSYFQNTSCIVVQLDHSLWYL